VSAGAGPAPPVGALAAGVARGVRGWRGIGTSARVRLGDGLAAAVVDVAPGVPAGGDADGSPAGAAADDVAPASPPAAASAVEAGLVAVVDGPPFALAAWTPSTLSATAAASAPAAMIPAR